MSRCGCEACGHFTTLGGYAITAYCPACRVLANGGSAAAILDLLRRCEVTARGPEHDSETVDVLLDAVDSARRAIAAGRKR